MLKAANGTASSNVSAIYFLGDISERAQIRISTVDDNRTYPSDLCCWKDFFEYTSYDDNVNMLTSANEDTMLSAIEDHILHYHMPGVTSA